MRIRAGMRVVVRGFTRSGTVVRVLPRSAEAEVDWTAVHIGNEGHAVDNRRHRSWEPVADLEVSS